MSSPGTNVTTTQYRTGAGHGDILMAITIPELEASNPAALLQAGERATAAAAAAGQQVSSARQMLTTMGSGWKGSASDAATGKAGKYIEQHKALQTVLQHSGTTLLSGGSQLTESRAAILTYVEQLKSQGWQVAADGSVSIRPGGPLELFARTSPVGRLQLQMLAAKASSELKVHLAQFSAQDQALAERLKVFRPKEDTPNSPDEHDKKWGDKEKLTPEEQAEVARWSQFAVGPGASDNGGGDCSRWAVASALANKYGVREGPNGREIDLPPDVQNNLMGGVPLHFPPTKNEINQISRRQGVAPGNEPDGFPGGPDLMTQQLNEIGIPSTSHTGEPAALVDQMTSDLQAGHSAVVNGAFPGSSGHFISVAGITTGPNGETLYLINDSNRVSDGNPNANTVPSPCTRSQLEQFLRDRARYGPPGYSTVE